MKSKRHDKILELIGTGSITTQDELLEKLCDAGFTVTQATVSRDIKELRLIKILNTNGKYCYAALGVTQTEGLSRNHSLLADATISIEQAMNIVAIKCFPGMAQAACVSVESAMIKGIVASLAGDDTIFVLCKDVIRATSVAAKLNELIGK